MDKFLHYLRCVKCESGLAKQNDFLVCGHCGEKYAIRDGIPVLINLNNLTNHLKGQVDYFEKEDNSRQGYKLSEWQKSYIKRLDENIKFDDSKMLVDIGTGSGYVGVEMAKRGLKVIACDLTLKGLVKLKKVIKEERLESNLFLVCCSAEELPFKDGIADYAVCNAVLEHLPQEDKAINEIERVCKQSSKLMITVPLMLKYIFPIFWIPTIIHDKNIGHLRKYDEKILSEKFEPLGYKADRIYFTGHFEKAFAVVMEKMGFKSGKWDKWAELRDARNESKKNWASNVCVIFKK